MDKIKELIETVRKEAQRAEFPVDKEVYEAAGLPWDEPILFYGDLKSPICFFARDLGKDEVKARQPLYGAAGILVRKGVYKMLFNKESGNVKELQTAADQILLTNTVPYKPPGNKAYVESVKKRFRPFLETLLTEHWKGNYIITLGSEAFKWFVPYAPKNELDNFFKQEDRYTREIDVRLRDKTITLAPLPHPSPLNQQYYHLFPSMLTARLDKVKNKFNPIS